ncbi:MAG: phosphoribosylamine--glycine ligase [Deltaproteobacteria bacterium]|nr:phosphoribosylamine--glycine ligase [Deltaproteobacteria bacterium]
MKERIDLTVVGPEVPLTLGIADEFERAGLRIFGPSRLASEIEGSKAFSKGLMARYNIPTARYREFSDPLEARAYVKEIAPPLVVKADGLAAGKGVVICAAEDEALEAIENIMVKKAFGPSGARVVIEEFLEGEEASFLAVTDGKTVVPLAPAQDHKAIYDGDMGPNTGGMGTYSPAPLMTPELEREVMERVMKPMVEAMEAEGRPYRGVLYAGLMIGGVGVKVLEFNCRFGDPETQPIMMRLEDDLFDLLMRAAEGRLAGVRLKWSDKHAVCVVMAAGGYPGDYARGSVISGLDEAGGMEDVMVFHAGTAFKDGHVVTSGGRVLGVTALGNGIKEAIERAYRAVELISWEGAYYRKDIGYKALRRLVR